MALHPQTESRQIADFPAKASQPSFFRKHGIDLFLLVCTAILLLHPDSRPWLTRRLFDLGFFKPNLAIKGTKPPRVTPRANWLAGVYSGDWEAYNGKWVLINFWAPWCPPCRAELPSLQELYQHLEKNNNLAVILVDVDADREKSGPVLQKSGITIPNLAPSGGIDPRLFSGTLPTTVLINPQGELVCKHEGVANYAHPRFVQQLESIIKTQH